MKSATRSAFTLLELLVAVTITLVLAGIMLSVTTSTLGVWTRTQNGFSKGSQAKLALDLMERDLHTAFYRRDGANATWLAVDVVNDANLLVNHGWQSGSRMKPAGAQSRRIAPPAVTGIDATISDARFGLSGAWLRFIGTNVESAGSLPTAISYQIVRRPVTGTNVSTTNAADVRYSFFRSAVSAENTFAGGYNVLGAAYGSSAPTSPTARAAVTLANPHTGGDTLATNVVDFGVWLYVRESSGALRRIFPENDTDFSHAASDGVAPADAARFPEVADVMLRVLTEEGARLLDALERGSGFITRPAQFATDDDWWWAVVEANSTVFTRRVEIKARPL